MYPSLLSALRPRILIAFTAAALAISAIPAAAQAANPGGTPPPNPSRFDLYGGYGYIHPVDSDINHNQYQPINPGAVVSATGYFNRYFGLQAEGSFFPGGPNDCIYTAQAGPVFRLPLNRFVPFAHALAGGAKVGGPVFQPCTWGWGVTGGIGFDYILPAFNNHLAIRPIQADFDYSHGRLRPPPAARRRRTAASARSTPTELSGGLVLRLGATSTPPPVQLGCTVHPVDVFPGDPITVSRGPREPHPQAPGQLRLVHQRRPGHRHHRDRAHHHHRPRRRRLHRQRPRLPGRPLPASRPTAPPASASTPTSRPPSPARPTPPPFSPAQTSTITAVARSPQNRTLTYSYTASSGQINGNGSNRNPLHRRRHSRHRHRHLQRSRRSRQAGHRHHLRRHQRSTRPRRPSARTLCALSFDRDRKRPVRVDNEAKGCLDDIALTLNRDSTATPRHHRRHHGDDETPDAAAERVLNVEQYLTDEKGVDPSRIELRTGDTAGRIVDNTLVPAGATFNTGAPTFDGSSINAPDRPTVRSVPAKPSK